MNLGKKLNITFISLLIFVLMISAFTSIYTFDNTLKYYLRNQRQTEFNQIKDDITEIIKSQNGLNPFLLELYSKNKGILIKYYNNEKKLLLQYDNLDYKNNKNLKNNDIVKSSYNIINSNNEIAGTLEVSYIDNVYSYNKIMNVFQSDIITQYVVIFIISIIIATILIVLLSKNITIPIKEIQDKTKKLIEKKYVSSEKKYDIYELDELSDNINYLSKSLKMQEQYRIDYSHDIAHELRTPITNLILHLEAIKDEIIDADKETISMLLSETRRISSMIDNLEITFNKKENFNELKIEDFDIVNLLETVSSSFEPLLKEKNIKLVKNFDKSKIINSDYDKLTQVVANIISNAIKASNENGTIQIIFQSFSNRDVITISDNGIGISKDDLPHIFERFYRVDNVRNTKVSGQGLGLAITKTYVELLGFKIDVNSELGKGTDFTITM
ncbi:HAMP domain-containing sensor histidine kinase [Helcococcus ovis]|uniref:histidine kinase n=7 Tax=Helcococcus ovis TaxID=72026 RepID=A0A4R9C1H9_9FIRM|nr:HAMP domain-containing sensor histidine kinase [Helcococcus ovis]TFF64188.1 HAMP domain-containing histidine kinase [Helcococcus ovis]TFF66464.1 HAMP domain-containing histidine kinase [Helcococcus ovis]TFF66926.1 HAMP domain-containing histidine kinase [Helcococcus ovis]WNZ01840.1 HAMP domain-containing sensor histidine kinase [Helcococcus ovis]